MGIARFSVNRPVAVSMQIAALVLLGLVCLTKLPVDLLPAVSIPTVAVVTQWPNVSPEEIETQVTRPIEESVSSVTNLYDIQSTSSEGVSTVRVQFQWGTDIGQGAVDVLQLVERARQQFPTDPTLQTPIVFKYDPSSLPILIYGVTGIKDSVKLRTLMDNEVTPMIESANGVASAVATGGNPRDIIVDVDPERLKAYNLSLSQIINRIAQENQNIPAGIARESNTEFTIRSIGWFNNVQEIEQVPIGAANGQTIPLSAVATVKDSHQETRLYTRMNQVPAVGMIVVKQSAANTIGTAVAVKAKIAQVERLYPELHFQLAYDSSTYIANSINDLRMNALLGGGLAIIILLFFLRNVRSTLVVALSIPISIVATFGLLYIGGFTINTMSLSGLALATGLIVDDAVVVLENIFRHIERDKKSPWDAAISGANEIMMAVLASTFTVMIVFLPLMMIKGQAGEMFTQFALVVIFSLAVSLLDAMTVVPMLASRLISGEAHHESDEGVHLNWLERLFLRFGRHFDAMDNAYRHGLQWAIHHRLWILAGAALATLASFLLLPQIGTEMMPQTDSGDFSITVKMPIGTALAKTDETVRAAEKIVAADPDVQTAFAASGTTLSIRGTTTALIPNQGSITIHLKDARLHSTLQVIQILRQKLSRIPGARFLINQTDIVSMLMTGGPAYIEVDVFGQDLSTLSTIGHDLISKMRTIPGLQNLDVNWQDATPEIQWRLDRDKALLMGVTFADMSNTLNTASNGTIASYYQENGFSYPIYVQMPQKVRKTLPELLDLMVTPSLGGAGARPVTLQQVAHVVYGMGPSEITRQDRQRYIGITGMQEGRSQGDIENDMQKILSTYKMPRGYYWAWGLNQERQKEEFGGLGVAVVLAVGLIYLLLAAQFESFIHPLTVLASVPLSAVGVILALFLSGRDFGLTAFIGLLMLVGIVVKNGILLVDYTNQLRDRGMDRDEAVLRAGPTRLRPILMTASAAILGMLPIALGLGKGSEIQAPMATAVVGGLATSTILTLFVVPTVYTLFDDLSRLVQHRKNGGRSTPARGVPGQDDSPDTTIVHGPEGGL